MENHKAKYQHLVLFDGDCPVCNLAVRHIIAIDAKHGFIFAPLKGEKAREVLGAEYEVLIKADTMILVENHLSKNLRLWIRSRAFLRIYWVVGRRWKLLGSLSFFPGWIGDIFYRLFSLTRYQFKVKISKDAISENRLFF